MWLARRAALTQSPGMRALLILCCCPTLLWGGVTEYGVSCATGVSDTDIAPDTVLGEINILPDGREILWPQSEVPAALGIGFGLWFDTTSVPRGMTLTTITHPPMGPQGVTRESWKTFQSGDTQEPHYVGYTLELPYELVRGPWRVEVTRNGKTLAAQDFVLVAPEAYPEIIATCRSGEDLVS
ncbi:MAG: hypothetical protein CSA72_12950 [Rhodobacterales bacterium]|nr:MAG: hypothetical protein CSA72_12950 [Rhodobacterales bacterium]